MRWIPVEFVDKPRESPTRIEVRVAPNSNENRSTISREFVQTKSRIPRCCSNLT